MRKGKLRAAFAAAAATLTLGLAGCASEPTSVNTDKITYVKDTRTDLCFAEQSSSTYGSNDVTSFTNVECTDAVVANIPNNPKKAIEPVYGTDARTAECFAQLSSYTHGDRYVVSIARVPCTPQVKALIPGTPR